MRTKYNTLFNSKDFKKIYKKTAISGVFYLDTKAPIAAQYELTSGCNQKCIFCYNVWKEGCVNKKKKTLSKNKQLKVIDLIIKNEIFDIILSGGEPLTIPWLEELIKKLSDKKIQSAIITNGTLLTKERAIKLKKAGLVSMQISLHHYTKELNDTLTNLVGSFDKTVAGIKNAVRFFGKERVNVNMVALPTTYKGVYDMAKFLHSIGVISFTVATPSATGKMKRNKEIVINKRMFLEIYKQLIKAKKKFKMNVGFTGGFPMCILPKINEETINMIGNYCDAGLNQLVIDPEGNLKPCVCLNENLGNILKDKIKKVWANKKFLINIRKLKYAPEECRECKYISMCRGGCRASAKGYFGKINARDPLML